jgi:hypothetical protein
MRWYSSMISLFIFLFIIILTPKCSWPGDYQSALLYHTKFTPNVLGGLVYFFPNENSAVVRSCSVLIPALNGQGFSHQTRDYRYIRVILCVVFHISSPYLKDAGRGFNIVGVDVGSHAQACRCICSAALALSAVGNVR